ncbi:MAG: hypothetical protein RIC29_12200 [Rhodospirillaceae bacterium]
MKNSDRQPPVVSSLKCLKSLLSRWVLVIAQRDDGAAGLVTVLALLMVVGAFVSVQLANQSERTVRQTKATNVSLTTIRDALNVYAIQDVDQYLPCPADGSVTGATRGTAAANASGVCTINSGIVPFRTLGLSEQAVTDEFGTTVTYIVDDTDINVCNGAIGRTGNLDITVASMSSTNALFALVSHGQNRRGGYTPAGTQLAIPATANERQNCPNGAACTDPDTNDVERGPFVEANNGDTHFDDQVLLAVSSEFDDICAEIDGAVPKSNNVSAAGGQIQVTGTDGNEFALVDNPEDWTTIDLGSGNNNFGVKEGTTTDVVFLTSSGSRIFTVKGLFGGRGNDILYAANQAETFGFGGAGNDYIVIGSHTSDQVFYHGGSGDDVIVVNSATNIVGNRFNNTTQLEVIVYRALLANDRYEAAPAGNAPPTPTPIAAGALDALSPVDSDGRNALPAYNSDTLFPGTEPGSDISPFNPTPSGVNGGSGSDTLVLRNPGTFNFATTIPDNAIRGIERLDLRCNGIQTITLDEDAVLSMSDTNTVEVFLPNDEVDIVNLTGFTPGGAPAAAGTHTAGAATVIITQTTDTEPPLPPAGQPTICSVI